MFDNVYEAIIAIDYILAFIQKPSIEPTTQTRPKENQNTLTLHVV